ncbi:MAG: DUF418 domain-containing protein [Planctomycetes bacterium]|nr:DUF418 domain-containing protein [Planctomycetota bacterium]MCB9868789.1 DUF418 domain-containing protein [Planctomycetota bacterium]
MTPTTAQSTASGSERLPFLDALRGFALLGILVANIRGMPCSTPPTAPIADTVGFYATWLLEGKFYSLFSFLFGIGFSIQMIRGEQKGTRYVSFYLRRLAVLLVIGNLHAYLAWSGDILWLYATLGFLLLAFRRTSDRTVLAWALSLLLLPIPYYCALMVGYDGWDPSRWSIRTPPRDLFAWLPRDVPSQRDNSFSLGLGEILSTNAKCMLWRYNDLLMSGRPFRVLGMFLLGLYAGRKRIFENVEAHLPLIRRIFWFGLVAGLVMNLCMAVVRQGFFPLGMTGFYRTTCYTLGVHLLSLAYVAGLVLAWRTELGHRLLSLLVPHGRMALTNYLTQTAMYLVVFYRFGFALHPSLEVTLFGIVPGYFILQVLWSHLWFRLFPQGQGPAEWVWRRLTYGWRGATR